MNKWAEEPPTPTITAVKNDVDDIRSVQEAAVVVECMTEDAAESSHSCIDDAPFTHLEAEHLALRAEVAHWRHKYEEVSMKCAHDIDQDRIYIHSLEVQIQELRHAEMRLKTQFDRQLEDILEGGHRHSKMD